MHTPIYVCVHMYVCIHISIHMHAFECTHIHAGYHKTTQTYAIQLNITPYIHHISTYVSMYMYHNSISKKKIPQHTNIHTYTYDINTQTHKPYESHTKNRTFHTFIYIQHQTQTYTLTLYNDKNIQYMIMIKKLKKTVPVAYIKLPGGPSGPGFPCGPL
jgi:hypothetical protein